MDVDASRLREHGDIITNEFMLRVGISDIELPGRPLPGLQDGAEIRHVKLTRPEQSAERLLQQPGGDIDLHGREKQSRPGIDFGRICPFRLRAANDL